MPEVTDVTLSVEEKDMPNGVEADISLDICEMTLESIVNTAETTLAEVMANVESSHSIVRHSAARKFNQEDPIEAASAEMILQPNK